MGLFITKYRPKGNNSKIISLTRLIETLVGANYQYLGHRNFKSDLKYRPLFKVLLFFLKGKKHLWNEKFSYPE
jgi:hypothetical protein